MKSAIHWVDEIGVSCGKGEKLKIKSNLRWPGGKSKMIKNIFPFLPEKINKYYELFAGGASICIELLQDKELENCYINDIDSDLCNYYQVIKNPYQRNIFIEKVLYIKKNYLSNGFSKKFEEIKSNVAENEVDRAVNFFIINKSGFSGLKDSSYSPQAFDNNFTESSILRCGKIGNLFYDKNVIIENSTFEKSSILSKQNYFVYIDPPYYSNGQKGLYGKNGTLHKYFDHEKLFDFIKLVSSKNKVLISYDNCDFIKILYKDFEQIEFDKKYSMTNTGGNKCKTGKELLIKNY